jgi:hypothetical protein
LEEEPTRYFLTLEVRRHNKLMVNSGTATTATLFNFSGILDPGEAKGKWQANKSEN